MGNTWYSGAAANSIPAASQSGCQRRHVWIATTCPRCTSRDPSASIGNACPGSPKAPRKTPQLRQLGHQAQLLAAVLERPRHRRDDQRADAGVAQDAEPLARPRRADRTGSRCRSARRAAPPPPPSLLALQVQVLDLARLVLEPVARSELVVEVARRASPCRRRTARGTGASRRAPPPTSSVMNTLTLGAISKSS